MYRVRPERTGVCAEGTGVNPPARSARREIVAGFAEGFVARPAGAELRRDRAAFFCQLEEDRAGPSLQVPCWMFDRAVSCHCLLAEAAGVGYEDLLAPS